MLLVQRAGGRQFLWVWRNGCSLRRALLREAQFLGSAAAQMWMVPQTTGLHARPALSRAEYPGRGAAVFHRQNFAPVPSR